jgi:beta-galactosidase
MGARLWCVALAAVCSSTGYAQDGQYVPLTPEQRKTLTHSSQRLIVPLAGEWQRASLAEPDWRRVTLPYSEPTLDEFRYRRSFVIDDILIKKYEWQLYALGCNYRVEVYVNGQYLQSHLGGGVPFAIRIPDSYLVNGNNTLEIVVDNRLDASTTVPLRSTPHEAKVFGGIFRELFLIGMPSVYLSNVDMKTSFNGRDFSTANLEITASLVSGNLFQFIREDSTQAEKIVALQKTGVEVSAELRSVEDTNLVVARSAPSFIEIAANRNAQLKLNLAVVSPRLWSPNAPNLYSLVVTMRRNGAPLDDYIAPVGLYQATIEEVNGKKSLIFNGEPISIKAVSYVEESVLNGATVSVAEYERDVQMLKTLGANVLQVSFRPPHPYLAHLCSKHGILIMTDIGVRGTPASILGKENYVVTAQTIMKDYIAAYQNIPSIFAFGISDKAEEGTEELRNYTQKIREVTRGTSTKLLYKIVYGKTQALDAEGVDFIVFFMTAEDSQEFRAEAERLQTINAKKLSVFAFERLFQPDNHKGYSDPLSVEAQARYIRQRFRILQEYKISDNILIGSFSDYLAELPVLIANNDNQYVVTAGLLSRTRDTRLPYQMAKALFNDEKEPILETGNYKPEIPALYTVVSIAFLILFFVLLNASRRFREDVMRALIRPYNFYADIRDQRILSNVGTLALAIVLSATLGLIISSLLYFLRSNYLLDYVLAHFVTSNSVKEFINTVIWQPWASLLLATGISLAVICALTLFIRLCSFFVQSRIFMGDAFVISVWACLPIGFLLILTAGLYRVFATDTYILILLGLILYVLLWSLYRVLRGTAVIYDVRASRVYIIGLGLLLLVVGSLAIYYDARYSTFAFARYFFAVLYP